jgi:single-stranded DNA-binding protein
MSEPVVALNGNIIRPPLIRETPKGRVLEFSMAVAGGDDAPTVLYNVSCWDEGLFESVPGAGDVAVEGSFSQREYDRRTYNKLSTVRVGAIGWLE